jgi:transcriptional regulator NrdR family protein
MLTACNGPECPRCGCLDSRVIRQPRRPAWLPGVAECGYCAHRFRFAVKPEAAVEAPKVVFHRPRCPDCQSLNLRVQNTQPKDDAGRVIRYLRCDRCKARLKSIENAAGEMRIVVLTDGEGRK